MPQQRAAVIERLGRFHATLEPGFHFLIPFIDRIAYIHSLKEEAITIPNQTAITRDNVVLQIDGVLYLRIRDPYAASYGVTDPIYALTQLVRLHPNICMCDFADSDESVTRDSSECAPRAAGTDDNEV